MITLIKNRPRLVIAFIAGTLIGLSSPPNWPLVTRFLLGWNCAVWSYLILMLWLMVHATSDKIAQLADQEDRADSAIIAIMSLAAFASLAAIVGELGALKELSSLNKFWNYIITIATVLGTWFFIATLYTFHYARLYYRSPTNERALRFPDAHLRPNYWDFLYFSFTIAVAAQTSDIEICSRTVRKTTLLQSVISFWFNIAVLGLSIYIAAGLVGS